MTRIGLMSDTHGDLDKKIFTHLVNVDEIWHAGDVGDVEVIDKLTKFKPLRGVFGNIDGQTVRKVWKETEVFTVERMKVVIHHIGGRPNRYNEKSMALLTSEKPQIFVCGHSHILLVEFDKKMNCMWLNPGACGNKGFHHVKTLLRFEIHGAELKNMEVVELGKRA